jgi:TATA-box binding protein (TBP) (component of TFIID and TFIIIB)
MSSASLSSFSSSSSSSEAASYSITAADSLYSVGHSLILKDLYDYYQYANEHDPNFKEPEYDGKETKVQKLDPDTKDWYDQHLTSYSKKYPQASLPTDRIETCQLEKDSLLIRFAHQNDTARVFSSGDVVVMGSTLTNSLSDAQAIHELIQFLAMDSSLSLNDFQIIYTHAIVPLPFSVNESILQQMVEALDEYYDFRTIQKSLTWPVQFVSKGVTYTLSQDNQLTLQSGLPIESWQDLQDYSSNSILRNSIASEEQLHRAITTILDLLQHGLPASIPLSNSIQIDTMPTQFRLFPSDSHRLDLQALVDCYRLLEEFRETGQIVEETEDTPEHLSFFQQRLQEFQQSLPTDIQSVRFEVIGEGKEKRQEKRKKKPKSSSLEEPESIEHDAVQFVMSGERERENKRVAKKRMKTLLERAQQLKEQEESRKEKKHKPSAEKRKVTALSTSKQQISERIVILTLSTEPPLIARIDRSGYVQIYGSTRIEQARQEARTIAHRIQFLHSDSTYSISFLHFRITFLQATVFLNFEVNVDNIEELNDANFTVKLNRKNFQLFTKGTFGTRITTQDLQRKADDVIEWLQQKKKSPQAPAFVPPPPPPFYSTTLSALTEDQITQLAALLRNVS